MLINVDDSQNIKVEQLLDEGISIFKKTFNNGKKLNNNLYIKHDINNFQNITSIYPLNEKKSVNSYNINNNYITYNGQNTELINKTINALNTGLKYLPKNTIEKFENNTIKNNNKKRKISCLIKKAPKNDRTRKNKMILKNNSNKKIDIKNKLINEKQYFKNPTNNNRKKNFNTVERISNHSSIIQNISTIDNSIKNYNNTNSIRTIIDKKDKKTNFKKNLFRNKTLNKLKNKKIKLKAKKWEEKYEEIKTLCNNTKKQISDIRNDNNYIEFRINGVKDKSNNIKRIINKSIKKRKYIDELKNKNEYNKDIIIKQKNLIEKISNEIDTLKHFIIN